MLCHITPYELSAESVSDLCWWQLVVTSRRLNNRQKITRLLPSIFVYNFS